MKPMAAAQCVTEALQALDANRATVVPGQLTRLMVALVPKSVARDQTAKMLEAAIRRESPATSATAERTS